MKIIHFGLALGVMLLAGHATYAQEYKIPVENAKDGQLILEDFVGDLPIEGYDGTEIIITADHFEKTPDQAKGLKPVYSTGTDNTGIGLSVNKDGGRITVQCIVPFTKDVTYHIKMPKSLSLKFERGCERSSTVTVSNLSGEVDIKNCQDIELKNVTGPLVLNTISGNIKVVFTEVSKDKPISIASISGDVDVTLPAKTPANLEMSTISGNMYTDFDLSADEDKDNVKRVGGNKLHSKLNGGGVELKITSISGHIYLRKG